MRLFAGEAVPGWIALPALPSERHPQRGRRNMRTRTCQVTVCARMPAGDITVLSLKPKLGRARKAVGTPKIGDKLHQGNARGKPIGETGRGSALPRPARFPCTAGLLDRIGSGDLKKNGRTLPGETIWPLRMPAPWIWPIDSECRFFRAVCSACSRSRRRGSWGRNSLWGGLPPRTLPKTENGATQRRSTRQNTEEM